jgi:tRNA-dihydrouridine synthase
MKGGSCAALFKTPKLAQEILLAMKEAAGPMPVSVKIRIGDTVVAWEDWILALLGAQPAAISVHLRTRKEMSKVPAHWELMPTIVQFISEHTTPGTRPLVVGNGDVLSAREGAEKALATGCDGVMIGRGIFHNPWLFAPDADRERSLSEKLALLLEHARLYEKEFSGIRLFEPLKRFFKIYISGFAGAQELREQLYTAKNVAQLEQIIMAYKNSTDHQTRP